MSLCRYVHEDIYVNERRRMKCGEFTRYGIYSVTAKGFIYVTVNLYNQVMCILTEM